MGFWTRVLITILKIAPLGIYVRAGACKFELPILGCNDPLCPAAIGQEADCTPTANTAELKVWCENAWVGWMNDVMAKSHITFIKATCDATPGPYGWWSTYVLLKFCAVMELIGYVLLWIMPQFGAFWLTVYMSAGLHLHLTWLKESPGQCILQFTLQLTSLLVLCLESFEADNAPAPKAKAAPPTKAKAKAKKTN